MTVPRAVCCRGEFCGHVEELHRTTKRVITRSVCTLQQTEKLKNPGLHQEARYLKRLSYSLRYCAWVRDRFIRID
jgi:hypothetical protein